MTWASEMRKFIRETCEEMRAELREGAGEEKSCEKCGGYKGEPCACEPAPEPLDASPAAGPMTSCFDCPLGLEKCSRDACPIEAGSHWERIPQTTSPASPDTMFVREILPGGRIVAVGDDDSTRICHPEIFGRMYRLVEDPTPEPIKVGQVWKLGGQISHWPEKLCAVKLGAEFRVGAVVGSEAKLEYFTGQHIGWIQANALALSCRLLPCRREAE